MPDPTPTQPPRPQAVAQPLSSPSSSGAPGTSVISKALKITGQLESSENIQIDGEIDGDVKGVHVKIGQSAKVKGTVSGEEVEIAGTVDGKIEARKVVLASTAHMSGDVIHQDIRIESGAYVDGHVRPENAKPKPAVASAFKPAVLEKTGTGAG
ncbi:MAG TPA: polymer-forming cytoskeletal protein [Rhizomicrobium sp.]|jgi:cytoskeletal protein CcmA (bactofilin family)